MKAIRKIDQFKLDTIKLNTKKINRKKADKTRLDDIKLIVYHDGEQVGVYQPYYIGLLGIFIKHCDLTYPPGTHLEIEIQSIPRDNMFENLRLPVVISSITNKGMGLAPEHYEPFHNRRWKTILNKVMSLRNNLNDISEVSYGV